MANRSSACLYTSAMSILNLNLLRLILFVHADHKRAGGGAPVHSWDRLLWWRAPHHSPDHQWPQGLRAGPSGFPGNSRRREHLAGSYVHREWGLRLLLERGPGFLLVSRYEEWEDGSHLPSSQPSLHYGWGCAPRRCSNTRFIRSVIPLELDSSAALLGQQWSLL